MSTCRMAETERMASVAIPHSVGGSGLGGSGTGTAAEAPPEVPPELLLAVLSRLPHNEVALSARRTCKAAAQHFAEEHYRTAAIGKPLPPHAASGPLEEAADTAFRSLTLNSKLRTLSIAAASGSIANLEVALRLLRPCVFPELLQTDLYLERLRRSGLQNFFDAGTAAVRSTNPAALSWLLDLCPGLVDRSRTLAAAATHCQLPQLQEAWALLGGAESRQGMDGDVLDAAAAAATPDAIAKMEWLLKQGSCSITHRTAAAAARSGDLGRLRWLRERGCPFDNRGVLEAALQHADLSVAEWLADEAGCPLPGGGLQDAQARASVVTAAAASGKVAKLRWLQVRGIALLPALKDQQRAMQAAAQSGSLEVVQFLHQLRPDGVLNECLMEAAAMSGSLDVAAYLLKAGCPVDHGTWFRAGQVGNVAMVCWLAEAAQLHADDVLYDVVMMWPDRTAEHSRQLLEVVRLVAPPGGSVSECTLNSAFRFAACRGDVGLMRYLHEELGAELGTAALEDAAYGGCVAAIEWLVERGSVPGEVGMLDRCYTGAVVGGDLATLSCLRRLGVPWSEGLCGSSMCRCRLCNSCGGRAYRWASRGWSTQREGC